jgi:hypothetical protein
MSKERPILFSAPMVKAILDGSKTQTRRIAKEFTEDQSGILKRFPRQKGCKYGEVGQKLWVRETWAPVNSECGPGFAYRANSAFIQPKYDGPDFGAGPSFNYDKYPGEYTMWYTDLFRGEPGHPWKPSLHMPRWASRILLEITDIRVERLQDISEDDAIAEGIKRSPHGNGDQWLDYPLGSSAAGWTDPRDSYKSLWESINGPDSWDANPWVWVVCFKDISDFARGERS